MHPPTMAQYKGNFLPALLGLFLHVLPMVFTSQEKCGILPCPIEGRILEHSQYGRSGILVLKTDTAQKVGKPFTKRKTQGREI